MAKFARRVDANHAEVIRTYRSLGCTVKDVSRLPGFVDLVVGAFGENHLVEVKDGEKAKSRQRLTYAEQEFHDQWRGTIKMIRSVDDAVEHVQEMREGKVGSGRS